MSLYEEIVQENLDILLRSLAERTLSGKQEWTGLRYHPIGFIQDEESGEREAYISHMFEAETEFNGRIYQVELAESISLPIRQGDIFGSVFYETEDGDEKYDFGIPEKFDEYGEPVGRDWNAGEAVVKLANAIVTVFKGTEAEVFGFSYARYFNQNDIKGKWKKDKLVKLGEKFMEEKRMEDFHKIVSDAGYLERMLREK